MSNTYRVLLPLLVNGEHKQGDVFEHEFDSPEDEQANLQSGLLEIVPREYKVVGPTQVYETDPGGTFKVALTIGQEAHLVDAGHIRRVEDTETTKSTKKKEA